MREPRRGTHPTPHPPPHAPRPPYVALPSAAQRQRLVARRSVPGRRDRSIDPSACAGWMGAGWAAANARTRTMVMMMMLMRRLESPGPRTQSPVSSSLPPRRASSASAPVNCIRLMHMSMMRGEIMMRDEDPPHSPAPAPREGLIVRVPSPKHDQLVRVSFTLVRWPCVTPHRPTTYIYYTASPAHRPPRPITRTQRAALLLLRVARARASAKQRARE